MNDRLPKLVKVFIVWGLFLWALYGFYSAYTTNGGVSLSGAQRELMNSYEEKYKDSHNSPGNLAAIPIEQIDAQTLNQHQLYIVMDLSVSVNAQYTQKQKDKIITDIVNKIKTDFVNRGFNTNLYFFGATTEKIEAQDIANFSDAALQKYKTRVNENVTDIVTTLFQINNEIRNGNKEKNKENLVVVITDDVHSTQSKIAPQTIEELKTDFDSTTKDNSASFYLLKYSGQPSQKTDTINFITNNLGEFFKKTEIGLDKVSREITDQVHNRMYLHDLTAPLVGASFFSGQNLCLREGITYYNYENEIFAGRLVIRYLGSATDAGQPAEKLKIYSNQNLIYCNFNVENKYGYFPVRLNINEISVCGDESVNLKIDTSDNLKVQDIILKPNESITISVPLRVTYKSSSMNKWINQVQPFFAFGENMNSINLAYNYEILSGKTILENKDFITDLKSGKNSTKNLFEIKEDKILVNGNQISELNKTNAGSEAALLQKSYSTSWLASVFWLALCLFLGWYFTKSKPSLNGWKIEKDGQGFIGKTSHNKPFRIGGGYEDPQGDVVITPFKYVISFFNLVQPKDIIEINFKYGAEIIDSNGEVKEGKQGRVYLRANENIQARIYEDIDLNVF